MISYRKYDKSEGGDGKLKYYMDGICYVGQANSEKQKKISREEFEWLKKQDQSKINDHKFIKRSVEQLRRIVLKKKMNNIPVKFSHEDPENKKYGIGILGDVQNAWIDPNDNDPRILHCSARIRDDKLPFTKYASGWSLEFNTNSVDDVENVNELSVTSKPHDERCGFKITSKNSRGEGNNSSGRTFYPIENVYSVNQYGKIVSRNSKFGNVNIKRFEVENSDKDEYYNNLLDDIFDEVNFNQYSKMENKKLNNEKYIQDSNSSFKIVSINNKRKTKMSNNNNQGYDNFNGGGGGGNSTGYNQQKGGGGNTNFNNSTGNENMYRRPRKKEGFNWNRGGSNQNNNVQEQNGMNNQISFKGNDQRGETNGGYQGKRQQNRHRNQNNNSHGYNNTSGQSFSYGKPKISSEQMEKLAYTHLQQTKKYTKDNMGNLLKAYEKLNPFGNQNEHKKGEGFKDYVGLFLNHKTGGLDQTKPANRLMSNYFTKLEKSKFDLGLNLNDFNGNKNGNKNGNVYSNQRGNGSGRKRYDGRGYQNENNQPVRKRRLNENSENSNSFNWNQSNSNSKSPKTQNYYQNSSSDDQGMYSNQFREIFDEIGSRFNLNENHDENKTYMDNMKNAEGYGKKPMSYEQSQRIIAQQAKGREEVLKYGQLCSNVDSFFSNPKQWKNKPDTEPLPLIPLYAVCRKDLFDITNNKYKDSDEQRYGATKVVNYKLDDNKQSQK